MRLLCELTSVSYDAFLHSVNLASNHHKKKNMTAQMQQSNFIWSMRFEKKNQSINYVLVKV